MKFEALILTGEFYSRCVNFSITLMIIICAVMVVASVLLKKRGGRILVPLMWYVNIPKMVFSMLAVILVFCYDYNTKTIRLPKIEDMYVSTFLVGILALIEILSFIASIIKDVHDMRNSDNVE